MLLLFLATCHFCLSPYPISCLDRALSLAPRSPSPFPPCLPFLPFVRPVSKSNCSHTMPRLRLVFDRSRFISLFSPLALLHISSDLIRPTVLHSARVWAFEINRSVCCLFICMCDSHLVRKSGLDGYTKTSSRVWWHDFPGINMTDYDLPFWMYISTIMDPQTAWFPSAKDHLSSASRLSWDYVTTFR